MNVKQLKSFLEGAKVPDDAQVVVPYDDHSYRNVRPSLTTALFDERGDWTEDHGEDVTSEAEFGKRVQVLVFE